jgi:putative chitobiose transport system permease protein
MQTTTVAVNRVKSGTASKRRRKTIVAAYLFLLPAIVLFLTFDYLPVFSAVFYSFHDYHVLAPAKWIGIDNYKQIMDDPLFWKSMRNSFTYFIIIVPFLVTLPLFLAMLLNMKLKGMYMFRVIYYFPVITSMVAVAILWKYLYHPAGLLNSVLQYVGLDQSNPINWLLNVDTAIPAISALEIWKSAGFYMIIYLAALQMIPHDLIEAAKIDGATRARILWHVYLPLLRPTFAVTLVLATLATIQIFTSVYVMTGGGPLNATLSLPLYVYQKAFVELDMGYASAMGIVLWVILMLLTYLNLKISRGERADA